MHWSGNIVLILTITTSALSSNIQLLKDYAKWNHITVVSLISCERYKELVKIESIENLQSHGLWTNILDISTVVTSLTNLNSDRFFGRYSNAPGIVINLQCNHTKAFMAKVSELGLFHNERKWFMISESFDEAYNILNQQNINFDAEIHLVIPANPNFYDIYEVYNPSHIRGGLLNVTWNGYWNESIGWTTVNQTKIERRHDLNGITFPTVVPVKYETVAGGKQVE